MELLLPQLLCVVSDNPDGSDGVFFAGGQRSGTFQNGIQFLQAGCIQRTTNHVVLYDTVLDLAFAQLCAQLGIFRNGDTTVIHQYTRLRILELLDQSGDNGLFRLQYFCVRHIDFTSL